MTELTVLELQFRGSFWCDGGDLVLPAAPGLRYLEFTNYDAAVDNGEYLQPQMTGQLTTTGVLTECKHRLLW